MSFIIGEKGKSTQVYTDAGIRIPVTFINTNPCYIVDVKDPVQHRYFAVKLGFGATKNIKKTVFGEITKAGVKTPLRFLCEVRLEKYGDKTKLISEGKKKGIEIGEAKMYIGDEIKPSLLFKKGDLVDVSGTSKGKGFQGVVRRHHFAGGPKTHGQSDRQRSPGAIGQTTTPGRVYKGKRMAGKMGFVRVTEKQLIVVDAKDDGLLVKGLIPGSLGSLIEVRKSI